MDAKNAAHPKEVLINQTPHIVSETASNVVLFLEKYGWFIIFGVLAAVLIWSKLEPYWRKWKKKRDKQVEEQSIDPVTLAKTQEALEMSRRRMQVKLDAQAAEYAEKMKELEEVKRQDKIDDWERHQKGRGYKSKHAKDVVDDKNQQENKVKSKKSGRLRNTDYNPLTGGSSSGTSFRPASRRSTGGG